jgi:hypothetical protein
VAFGSLFYEEYARMLEMGYKAWKKDAEWRQKLMEHSRDVVIPAMARNAAASLDHEILRVLETEEP